MWSFLWYNEIGGYMIYILVIVLIVIVIICLCSNNEKKEFKSIDFKDKKLYLCCVFLHGNCGLKTNKAVLSRNNDEFLIETEDKDLNVQTFRFNKSDILNVEINETLSTKRGSALLDNFTTGDTIGKQTTFTSQKTMKFKKVYDIRITLKNDINMHIQSDSSPYFLFSK